MIILAGLIFASSFQQVQAFEPQQRQALLDALYVANLVDGDLRSEGAWGLGNPFVAEIHRDPLPGAAKLRELSASHGSSENSIARLRRAFLAEEFVKRAPKSREIEFPEEIPLAIRDALGKLVSAVLDANEEVRASLSALSSAEKRELIEGLPRHAVHSSLLGLDFVKEKPASWPHLLDLVAKIDLKRLRNAAENLSVRIETTIPALNSAAPSSFQSKVRFAVEGIPIVVSGFGDDLHEDKDAGLTIDFGGSDRYSGRHGAGIGYASVMLDLDGSDTYTVPDLSLGAGLLGIGLAWDIGGEDVVRGKSICLGAGIAGAGAFFARGRLNATGGFSPDAGDLYDCSSMGLGFGLFGMGVHSDSGGDDVYRSQYLSQGCALSNGVGSLEDEAGSDRYFADGLAPTLEDDSILRSRSQGFGGRIGFGLSEPGGIGQLTDVAGRDVYVAGAEAQGCGLDGGLGFLVGTAEGDTYRIEGNGQGYGARSGVGILIDPIGDDEYICSQSAAQGVATDSGIGILLDWKGSDLHAMGSGSPGYGAYGGLGVLLDWEGYDRYSSISASHATPLESRGIGLLLDLGGSNQVAGTSVGPVGGVSGAWSVVAMLESRRETDSVSPPELKPTALPMTPEEVESTIAEAAGVADYATRTMRFQAKANLSAFPKGILVWLSEQARPLHNAEARLLGELFRNASEDMRAELSRLASSTNFNLANNALAVLAESDLKVAGPSVLNALQNNSTARLAARAALALGLKDAAPELMLLCASPDPMIRREAAVALSRLGGPEALSTAQVLLSNEDPIIRKAAVELIGRIGTNLEPFKSLVASSAEPGARAAMQAIGSIGGAEALDFLGTKLNDTRASIRIEALRALAGRCPRPYRAAFEAKKEDADSRVRTVAMGVEPGR